MVPRPPLCLKKRDVSEMLKERERECVCFFRGEEVGQAGVTKATAGNLIGIDILVSEEI